MKGWKHLAAAALLLFFAATSGAKEVRIPARYQAAEGSLSPRVKPAEVPLSNKVAFDVAFVRKALRPVLTRAVTRLRATFHAPRQDDRTPLGERTIEALGDLGREALRAPHWSATREGRFAELLNAKGTSPGEQLRFLSYVGLSESDLATHKTNGLEHLIRPVFENVRAEIEGKGLGEGYERLLRELGVATADGKLETYDTGPKAFGRIFELMDQAIAAQQAGRRAFIVNSTFSLKPDFLGTRFAARLRRFARLGGEVASVYEPVGSTPLIDGRTIDVSVDVTDERTLQQGPNGRFLAPGQKDGRTFFTRIIQPKGQFQGRVSLSPTKASPLNDLLNHRKATIVGFEDADGRFETHVVNTDMNNSDEYLLWRGYAHEITGPAVAPSVENMIHLVDASADRPMPDSLRTLMRTPQAPVEGGEPIDTVGHEGQRDLNIKNTLLVTMDAMPANGHLIVRSPYLDDPDVFEALIRAARRVKGDPTGHAPVVIVPKSNDQKAVAGAFEANAARLIRAGVEVYYFDDQRYLDGFFHSKSGAVFYRDAATGRLRGRVWNGSSNLDARSLRDNWEEIHMAQSPRAMAAVTRSLVEDLEHSQRVTVNAAGRLVVDGAPISRRRALIDRVYAQFGGLL